MTAHDDETLAQRLGEVLRESEHELDALTLARLRAARLRALQSAQPRRRWLLATTGLLGTAAALLLALGAWWLQLPAQTPAALEDLPLLSAAEELELLDDLDFYLWLEFDAQAPEASPLSRSDAGRSDADRSDLG